VNKIAMKVMNDTIFNRIKEFINKQSGTIEEKITECSSLENDLGIYGDDAVEFFISFGKEFNVDVSKFMAAEYFTPEGDVILPCIIRWFTGKKKSKRKDLTIKHLMKAITFGRLDEEVINN
jgi:acyl carrier protein